MEAHVRAETTQLALGELIAAAQRGERVVITKRGEPAVELVGCPKPREKPKGDFFDRVKEARKRLGITPMPPDEAREFRAALFDSELSCRVLGIDNE